MHHDPELSEPAPPGTHAERLTHPSGDTEREIELAIFKDHRFSFFYWLKWARKLQQEGPPTLITIDWHRDLAPPSETEVEALDMLNQQNLQETCDFTLNELDPHNDGHILSAAWLNLIGDIILLKNYGMEQQETWTDGRGNVHKILEFNDFETFQEEVIGRDKECYYLDVDLDYFIKNKVSPYQRSNVQIYEDEEICSVIDPEKSLFKHLFKNLEGITLATEPRYCGGVRNSNHILDLLLNQLFTQQMEWNHLR